MEKAANGFSIFFAFASFGPQAAQTKRMCRAERGHIRGAEKFRRNFFARLVSKRRYTPCVLMKKRLLLRVSRFFY